MMNRSLGSLDDSALDLQVKPIWKCENVRCDGNEGCIMMDLDLITFFPDGASVPKHWMLSRIMEHYIGTVGASYRIKFRSGDESDEQGEDEVTLKMASLPELIRFRKALVPRLRHFEALKQTTMPIEKDNSNSYPKEEPKEDDKKKNSYPNQQVNEDNKKEDYSKQQAKKDNKKEDSFKQQGKEDNKKEDYSKQQAKEDTTEATSVKHQTSSEHTSSEDSARLSKNDAGATKLLEATCKRANTTDSAKARLTHSTNDAVATKPVEAPFRRADTTTSSEARRARNAKRSPGSPLRRANTAEQESRTGPNRKMSPNRKHAQADSGAPVSDGNSHTDDMSSVDFDDIVVREVLQIRQTVMNEETTEKEWTRQNLSAGTSQATTSALPDEQTMEKERARQNLPAGTSQATTAVLPDDVLTQGMSDHRGSAQRGPGAYKRAPGRKSELYTKMSYSCISDHAARADGDLELKSLSAVHRGTGDNEDSVTGRSSSLNASTNSDYARHINAFDVSSRDLIEASLVEETSEVLMPSCVAVADEEKPHEVARYKFMMLACGFLVVAAIISIVVVVTAGESGGSATNVHGQEERFPAIKELLTPLITNSSQWEDPLGPAARACEWLSDIDVLEMDPWNEALRAGIQQRFLLAFFYYHTSKSRRWVSCNPPETGENRACQFQVLESYSIQGEYFDQQMVEPSFRWMSDTDECRWAGVGCDSDGHVTSISLAGYKLSGSLPVELANLRHLEALDLQQNRLTGTLPPEFKLGSQVDPPSTLRQLRLDRNMFSGTIPEEWCSGEDHPIEEWSLSSNNLTGSLPSCLGTLYELKDFSAMHNELTGTIPIMGGSNLEKLHLAYNEFEGSMPDYYCEAEFVLELSSDCLNKDADNFVGCSCCTKCCDPLEDICEVEGEMP